LNVSLHIARRYLVSKKKHNLINVISLISVIGQLVGTAALIIVLSVFNGFEGVIKAMYDTFDPDFVIRADEGKTFDRQTLPLDAIQSLEGVSGVVDVVEEDALFKYREQQYIARLKGVSENYLNVSKLDTLLWQGEAVLEEGNTNFAIVGAGVAWYLDISLSDVRNLLSVFVPRRGNASSFDFQNAFNNEVIHPVGVFSVQQEFDERYVIVPDRFARRLMDYPGNLVTSLEVYLRPGADEQAAEEEIIAMMPEGFSLINRFEQNEALYKVMRSEKMAIFMILAFILLLASFNMIGSLSILIVEKLKDIAVLKSMGADKKLIRAIFTTEGMLISLAGCLGGLAVGFLLLYLQQTFGFLSLGGGEGNFIIDEYPVRMIPLDFLYVAGTVLLIGLLATWYPVRFLTRKFDRITLK
jgi:lipoprotein-releasing system permease protein